VDPSRSAKKEEEEKNKKNDKKEKDPLKRQKVKKTIFFVLMVVVGIDLTAFPKGPTTCPLPFGPQIRAFHTNFDLLPIHIGSWSNIKLKQLTKKRVLQRVLRYYPRSTVFRCAVETRDPVLLVNDNKGKTAYKVR
jgi:hypothetical protein